MSIHFIIYNLYLSYRYYFLSVKYFSGLRKKKISMKLRFCHFLAILYFSSRSLWIAVSSSYRESKHTLSLYKKYLDQGPFLMLNPDLCLPLSVISGSRHNYEILFSKTLQTSRSFDFGIIFSFNEHASSPTLCTSLTFSKSLHSEVTQL